MVIRYYYVFAIDQDQILTSKKRIFAYMDILLRNVGEKHYAWLKEIARAMRFQIISVEEEDQYLLKAMEKGRKTPLASPKEIADFKDYLHSL